jgi:hypothetical protein
MGLEGRHSYLYAAAFFDLLARVAGRIVADPPRKDFRTSTRVRARFAKPQYLMTDEPSERLALEAAEAADHSEAYLAAHLRAFERLQGARQTGDHEAAAERAAEAVSHAHTSGGALRRLSTLVAELPQEPVAEREGLGGRDRRSGRPRLSDVDRESLAVLFLGGLRLRDLENVLRGTRMQDSEVAADRLPAAAAAFRDLGEAMEAWEPPSESEPQLA